jgi:hypothetical protein
MAVSAPPRKSPEEEADNDENQEDEEMIRTAQDITDTVLQLRMENEEKQRQIIIFQQRLVW